MIPEKWMTLSASQQLDNDEGIFLEIPADTTMSLPIHHIFQQPGPGRHVIIVGANSHCIFVEEHTSTAEETSKNIMTHIHLGPNSQLHYYKIQVEGAQTTHIATTQVIQKQDSRFYSFCLDAGGKLVREDIDVQLQESGTQTHLSGLYYLTEQGQRVENLLRVKHLAEHGDSSMFYKGILDKKSRAVFKGRVFVEKGAQKINAHQGNHNLLLAKDAEVDTQPELEIYANDVRCAHGATVGQLDAEALFYLRSRGMTIDAAKKILIAAFAEDVIDRIEHQDVRQYVKQRIASYDVL